MKKEKPEKPPVVPVNGKEADLGTALPLTIGDAEKMKALGIDLMRMDEQPETAFSLARYVLKKANPEITDDEISEIPVNWVQRIVQIIGQEQRKESVPF